MQFICSARNGPELLGMPDCEWLMLVTVNCPTTDDKHKKMTN